MKSSECKQKVHRLSRCYPAQLALAILLPGPPALIAQTQNSEAIAQQIQDLKSAMATTQSQLQQSQRQLEQMQQQLNTLELRVAQDDKSAVNQPSSAAAVPPATEEHPAQSLASAVDELREQQSMQAAQIATHDQTKVESESRYPVKITGLLLFNAFTNTRAVDLPATPSVSLFGPGNTGATVRQTILGFDARGPHIAGAESYADLRIDFDGVPQQEAGIGSYTGAYSSNATFLRLRTAHAGLQWKHTGAFFSLDRPIFNPDTPTSLTAVAVPALAWSGNLWTWNPQVGIKQTIPLSPSRDFQFEAALVDVGQSPATPRLPLAGTAGALPTSAEATRWPGLDAHIALLGSTLREAGNRIGIGGHIAPLQDPTGRRFTSWAGTADAHFVLPARLSLSANAYRGLALGGLGAGAYKDFLYYVEPDTGTYYFRPLDDIGGWAELKDQVNQRLELNAAFGLDNGFSSELRPYAIPGGNYYQNLARNRTATGNVIFKPSAYLLFSIEYRRIKSWSVDRDWSSDVVGLGAGFKF
ncbi:MAG: hypothetical protein JST28_23540 [Acidobacteria bacterium]|nr:hypothetical protein [Acidobacteriota bacterium]